MTGTLIAWVFWGVLLPWLVLRVWAEDRQAKRDLASQVRFSEARKALRR